MRLHESNANRILAITGNGFGKTTAGIHEFYAAITGRHWIKNKYSPPPLRGRIASEKDALTKKIIPMLHALFDNQTDPRYQLEKGYPKKMATFLECKWKLKNGSEFDLKTYDQNPKTYASVDLDIVLFDEPFTEAIWNETVPRMRIGKGGVIMITMTPLLHAAWMYDKWFSLESATLNAAYAISGKEQNFEVIKGSKWDNCKCLTPELHDDNNIYPIDSNGHCCCNQGHVHRTAIELEINEYDEAQLSARVDGDFIVMKDRVFPKFDANVHVLPNDMIPAEAYARELQFYVACDPHRRRPPAWILFGIDKDEIVYILDEWPNIHKGYYKTKLGYPCRYYDMINQLHLNYDMTIREFYDIEQFWGNVVRRFMDPRFGHDKMPNTNEKVIDAYRRHAREMGIDMKFYPAIVGTDSKEGEIASGVLLINQKLHYDKDVELCPTNMPGLFINPSCANVIRMFNYFKYITRTGKSADGRSPSEIFEEKFKDFADVVRYGLKSLGKKGYKEPTTDSGYKYVPGDPLTNW